MIARWVLDRVAAARGRVSRTSLVPLHVEWRRFLEALHAVGLASELDDRMLAAALGARALAEPDGEILLALLDGYYHGGGDADAALRRSRADRFVSHSSSDRATARQIIAKLRLAVPEIGPLALVDDRHAEAEGLALRTFKRKAPLPGRELDEDRFEHSGLLYARRTITVRALVAATNALLSARGIERRFVPLDGGDDIEAYLALAPGDAAVLDLVDLFALPLDELLAFAGWSSRPSAELASAEPVVESRVA